MIKQTIEEILDNVRCPEVRRDGSFLLNGPEGVSDNACGSPFFTGRSFGDGSGYSDCTGYGRYWGRIND